MDSTEIAESIGPLDTGETIKLLFYYVHVGHVVSDVRMQPAHPAIVSRKVVFFSPTTEAVLRVFSWHLLPLLQSVCERVYPKL